MTPLRELLVTDAQPGRVTWIGLRPARRAEMVEPSEAEVTEGGLVGDRASQGARPGRRALTLFQTEHLSVVAAFLGRPEVAPALLRRNILVAGINLSAFRGARLQVGSAVVEITGPCAPCSRMQEALGPGGYNALRGHGGWCASIVRKGEIRLGDSVARVGAEVTSSV